MEYIYIYIQRKHPKEKTTTKNPKRNTKRNNEKKHKK
jgi:hypothetical protein